LPEGPRSIYGLIAADPWPLVLRRVNQRKIPRGACLVCIYNNNIVFGMLFSRSPPRLVLSCLYIRIKTAGRIFHLRCGPESTTVCLVYATFLNHFLTTKINHNPRAGVNSWEKERDGMTRRKRKIRHGRNSLVFVYKRQSALLIGLILVFDINGCLSGVSITQDRNIKLWLSSPNDVCNSKMNLSDYFFSCYQNVINYQL